MELRDNHIALFALKASFPTGSPFVLKLLELLNAIKAPSFLCHLCVYLRINMQREVYEFFTDNHCRFSNIYPVLNLGK